MPHPLADARTKLERARAHLDDLDGKIGSYLDIQPIRVERRVESEGESRPVQLVATAAAEPPDILGLIVGDWANNVRAALDYTVYELARKETGDQDPRWTQFPIVLEKSQYEHEAARRLHGAPSSALSLIEASQPFNHADGASSGAVLTLSREEVNYEIRVNWFTGAVAVGPQ